MGLIGISVGIFYMRQDTICSIFFSMLVLLIINPYIINDIGFELSYLGTIGIVLFNENIESILSKRLNDKISKILSVSISAQIMIIPILMYKLNTISIVFPISNLLATPLLGIIIIFGIITISISFISFRLAKFLAILLNLVIELLNQIAKLTSKIPFGNFICKTPRLISIILIYIFSLLFNYFYYIYNFKKSKRIYEKEVIKTLTKMIKNRKRTYKILATFLIIITIISNIYIPIKKELIIYFIDVGQGDSCLIVTPNNKKILIDGGEGNDNTITSYLLDRRIKTLDYIIISHFDNDHVRWNLKCYGRTKCKKGYYFKTRREK